MIAAIVASFGCGVLATLIVLFKLEESETRGAIGVAKAPPRIAPWEVLTSLDGGVDLFFVLSDETRASALGPYLLGAAASSYVREATAKTKNPMIKARPYMVRVQWKAKFTKIEANDPRLPKVKP